MKDQNSISHLWNINVFAKYKDKSEYQAHILEQYKIYVEMADRISSRRATANAFFLTLNTLLVTLMSLCFDRLSLFSAIIICITAVMFCFAWKRLILSYQQLNTAKYIVIGEMETKLPASPYWSAEWKTLGEGRNPKLYKPLTDVEKWVPIIFILIYIVIAVAMAFI